MGVSFHDATSYRVSCVHFVTRGKRWEEKTKEILPPFLFQSDFTPLTAERSVKNLKDAVAASGAIPLVMSSVSGIYRDRGRIDYHTTLSFEPDQERIVIYPHYANAFFRDGWVSLSSGGVPWRGWITRLSCAHPHHSSNACHFEKYPTGWIS